MFLNNKKNQISANKCSRVLWKKYLSGFIPVIPDIKCESPGEGDLIRGRDPVVLARELEAAGAPVISVVTESKHYGGSQELLAEITRAVSVPVLQKDFINSNEKLLQSADNGASGVLLISSMLEKKQLVTLINKARHLGLEPLVETHTEDEIIAIQDLHLPLLGINNRDIKQWEMDNGTVTNTERLTELVAEETLVVSESSISSVNDIQRALDAGAHCVLVGTAILKAENSIEMYQKLSRLRR